MRGTRPTMTGTTRRSGGYSPSGHARTLPHFLASLPRLKPQASPAFAAGRRNDAPPRDGSPPAPLLLLAAPPAAPPPALSLPLLLRRQLQLRPAAAAAHQARLLRAEAAAAAGPARGVRRPADPGRWPQGRVPVPSTAAAADAAARVDAAGYAVREGRAGDLARLVPVQGRAAAGGPSGRRGGGGGAGRGAAWGGGADPDGRACHQEHLWDAARGGAAAVPDDYTGRQAAAEGRH